MYCHVWKAARDFPICQGIYKCGPKTVYMLYAAVQHHCRCSSNHHNNNYIAPHLTAGSHPSNLMSERVNSLPVPLLVQYLDLPTLLPYLRMHTQPRHQRRVLAAEQEVDGWVPAASGHGARHRGPAAQGTHVGAWAIGGAGSIRAARV